MSAIYLLYFFFYQKTLNVEDYHKNARKNQKKKKLNEQFGSLYHIWFVIFKNQRFKLDSEILKRKKKKNSFKRQTAHLLGVCLKYMDKWF